MKHCATIFLWLLALFVLPGLVFAPHSEAQELENCSGTAGAPLLEIDAAQLAGCVGKGKRISYAMLDGADIVSLAETTEWNIRIKNSRIRGGINFRRSPRQDISTALERIGEGGSDTSRFVQSAYVKENTKVQIISGSIRITDSVIESGGRRDILGRQISLTISRGFFLQRISFVGTRFKGYVSLSRSVFWSGVNFSRAIFDAGGSFSRSWFNGTANFKQAEFKGQGFFFSSRFSRVARFREATFVGRAIFGTVRFCEGMDFSRARFHGLADFSRVRVARSARFEHASFMGFANFQDAEFSGNLILVGSEVDGLAAFANAQIDELRFGSVREPTQIVGSVDFSGSRMARATFHRVTFRDDVSFSRAAIGEQEFDWTIWSDEEASSRLYRGAGALTACPKPEVESSDTSPSSDEDSENQKLKRKNWGASFRDVTFKRGVGFVRANLLSRAHFRNVSFEGDADFTAARFPEPTPGDDAPIILLSYVDFTRLKLRWPALPHPRYWARGENIQPLSEVLALLETHFRESGHLDDANSARFHRGWAEIQETVPCLTAGLGALTGAQDGRAGCDNGVGLLRALWDVSAGWVFGVLTGFGTKLWWIAGWIVLADIVFALIYWRCGALYRHRGQGSQPYDGAFRIRMLDLPRSYVRRRGPSRLPSRRARRLYKALRFSSVVLTKIGARDSRISGRIGPVDLRYIVVVEWWLGLALLAALVFTLTQTQPFIHTLISGALV